MYLTNIFETALGAIKHIVRIFNPAMRRKRRFI
jgi:hypothetical protein